MITDSLSRFAFFQSHEGGTALVMSLFNPNKRNFVQRRWSLTPQLTPPSFSIYMGLPLLLRELFFLIGEAEKQPGGPSVFSSLGKVTSAVPALEFVYLSLSQRDFVYRPFCYVPPERGKLPLSNC